ncbi:MAG: hypothetical protein DRJ26_03890 [Candidatus Methanomethylicota archaeon]|uniref:Uncharacterized protein n=1 Tax=Thermoproteota archaeon TaxID=2056631 RepID=A0A497F0Q7_9CREN|nr:MAG: hypothetical protein DRJ20_01830 [Candidatus Verstraetearchaeota archaeon]RLE53055.1 MAG: hypothetical protein DRJ26_03890 [Candidatus Verstraetearchaeota archaeon]
MRNSAQKGNSLLKLKEATSSSISAQPMDGKCIEKFGTQGRCNDNPLAEMKAMPIISTLFKRQLKSSRKLQRSALDCEQSLVQNTYTQRTIEEC